MIKNLIDLDTSKDGWQTTIRINGKEVGDRICGIRIEIATTEKPKIAFDYGSGYINWSEDKKVYND